MSKSPTKAKAPAKAKQPAVDVSSPAPRSLDSILSEIESQRGGSTADPGSLSSEQRKAAAVVVPDAATKEKMLAELAGHFGITPQQIEAMLQVNAPEMALVQQGGEAPKPTAAKQYNGPRAPIKLTHDYWLKDNVLDQWPMRPMLAGDGTLIPNTGNNRAVAGSVVHLPAADARLMIEAGKAERADPLPGEG